MKIVWTQEAQQDRAAIWDYIVAEDPLAAVRMDELFSRAVANLEDHPGMGHHGFVPGTLEVIPHSNYRLVYEIDGEELWILALVHVARQWPPVG